MYLDWRGEGLLHAMVEVPQAQLPADVCRHEQRRMFRRPGFHNSSDMNNSVNNSMSNTSMNKTVAGGYTYRGIIDCMECSTTGQTNAL